MMKRITAFFTTVFMVTASAYAQGPSDNVGEADLTKQLANPVANLISLPLQSNLDFGIGPNDATRYTLNIQPVIPFEMNDDWNLITRTILPVINAESPASGVSSAFGLGDTISMPPAVVRTSVFASTWSSFSRNSPALRRISESDCLEV